MTNATENTFLGALLGMAIGDALGAPLIGQGREQIAHEHGPITTYLEITAPDGVESHRGEFTDETEIALCLVESMTANHGRIDPETAGMRMAHLATGASRHWLQPETATALDRAFETLEFSQPLSDDPSPATGDVATRGVPIGLMHAVGRFDAARLHADALTAAQLTHGNSAAAEAVAGVAFLTRLAATGVPPRDWARETASALGSGSLARSLARLDEVLDTATFPMIVAEFGDGLAVEAVLPTAIAAVTSGARFEDAVFAAVAAGGATDTRGAVTGALAGARDGAAGIPQALIDGLEGRIYVSLAAPWFYKAARQRAGQLIDLRPVHGPRPTMPPRQ
ncbi:MAG: ADP-ribosylglycohydrolase family protein [Thermomicrobiales bacterium]|nr:ADP-ribosylglycohydrolase family protein [Thermomicrobiales bacterium]